MRGLNRVTGAFLIIYAQGSATLGVVEGAGDEPGGIALRVEGFTAGLGDVAEPVVGGLGFEAVGVCRESDTTKGVVLGRDFD